MRQEDGKIRRDYQARMIGEQLELETLAMLSPGVATARWVT